MTSSRNLLLIALLFIGYLMWMQWQEDYHRPQPATPAASAPVADGAVDASTPSAVPGVEVPAAAAAGVAAPPEPAGGAAALAASAWS